MPQEPREMVAGREPSGSSAACARPASGSISPTRPDLSRASSVRSRPTKNGARAPKPVRAGGRPHQGRVRQARANVRFLSLWEQESGGMTWEWLDIIEFDLDGDRGQWRLAQCWAPRELWCASSPSACRPSRLPCLGRRRVAGSGEGQSGAAGSRKAARSLAAGAQEGRA